MYGRREFLRWGVGAGAASLLTACGRKRNDAPSPAETAPAPGSGPNPSIVAAAGGRGAARRTGVRSIVLIHLDGGIDPVLTTLPRHRDQVHAEVDVPYEPEEIAGSEAVPLGPHFRDLAPFADRLAILNGVAVDSANHETGWVQVPRLRTRAFATMPTILDIIGGHRDSQPLATLHFGQNRRTMYSSGHADAFETLELAGASVEELRLVAHRMRGQAEALRKIGGVAEVDNTAANYSAVGAFAERLITTPQYKEEDWGPRNAVSYHLQRLLWALENDLVATSFVRVRSDYNWDSHNHNLLRQEQATAGFLPKFVNFLRELDNRKGPAGRLSDSTLVIVCSEIGRFPRLNGNQGKDHFPELPVMFYGAGIKGNASYGDVDERLIARPIDLATGRAANNGGHNVYLDDVGATVLRIAGIAPDPYGYQGADLTFLRSQT